MTQQETTKILAMLSAFYGQGKSDPRAMLAAWHLVLADYDYHEAEGAVIDFARNDRREYATFPAVGKIVEAIELYGKRYNRLLSAIYNQVPYSDISPWGKRVLNEAQYKAYLSVSRDDLVADKETFFREIKAAENQNIRLLE